MMHVKRTWKVIDVPDIPGLAVRLHGMSYTTCSGFRLPSGAMLLNDSTGPDGAQEYAVVSSDGLQVESLTVSWVATEARLVELIAECLTGPTFYRWRVQADQVESPEQHGRCHACA